MQLPTEDIREYENVTYTEKCICNNTSEAGGCKAIQHYQKEEYVLMNRHERRKLKAKNNKRLES